METKGAGSRTTQSRLLFHIGAVDEEAQTICSGEYSHLEENPRLPEMFTAAARCNGNVPPICATGGTQGTR